MKESTHWYELAEFIDSIREVAEACEVTLDEMLNIFITLKNN